MNNFFKGSEWIKCDLHIHTPYSIEHHYGDSQNEETWEKFILDIETLPTEFKIIGINDYLFLDGYEKVIEFKNKGRLNNIDLILPVIELRIDKFGALNNDNPFKRVNFHVIFSNELTPDVINAQFLASLSSEYKLFPEYESNESDWGGVINKANLISLGEKLISSSNGNLKGNPLKIGFQSLNISYGELIKKLDKNLQLKGKYLTAVGKTEWDALRWEGSPAEKKSVINKADFVFTASDSIENFEKAKNKLISESVNDLLLDCSDAHSFSNTLGEKDRIGNCLTWLKINPTFEGLKYITFEPNERIFIGKEPEVLKRVDLNKTRYISRIIINQIAGYDESQGIWFKNQEIYPSKELTAIIGNKGKGKSAISDIIGLLGNSHNEEYFSFLSKNKFRKLGLAKNFNGVIEWESKTSFTKNLADNVDKTIEEKVKYLPQSYFENLCNDLESNDNFIKELNQVVFKHIDITERLGKNTFDEFIDETKKTSESKIRALRGTLSEINLGLVDLLEKNTKEHIQGIESKIKNLGEDLISLESSIPIDPFPQKDNEVVISEETSENYRQLKVIELEINQLLEEEKNYNTLLEIINSELLQLDQIKHRFLSEKERIDSFVKNEKIELSKFNLDIDKIYNTPKINLSSITDLIDKKNKEKLLFQLHLGKINFETVIHQQLINRNDLLITKIEIKKEGYAILLKSLSDNQKLKESYNIALTEWNKNKKSIEGSSENPHVGSLQYYKNQILYIENSLQKDITAKKDERKRITLKIFEEKEKIVSIYRGLKSNIDKILSENADKIEEYKISLEASFQIKDLEANFLEYIDKNRSGSFYGKEDSLKKIKSEMDELNPNDKSSLIDLIVKLTDDLEINGEEKQNPFVQIKSSKKLVDLYDYVFGLDFLFEKYELTFGKKSIEQLSPGERGAALIVFYLLLDNDDKPLIIDQPEDNLDNQSVFEILVPFIKQAKRHRQIILVTHNPNLAVVADAEQVIYANINKENKYEFSTISGGIENPLINKKIVTVLEGTMPAFNKRKSKYNI